MNLQKGERDRAAKSVTTDRQAHRARGDQRPPQEAGFFAGSRYILLPKALLRRTQSCYIYLEAPVSVL
jgi:hypothetical protein